MKSVVAFILPRIRLIKNKLSYHIKAKPTGILARMSARGIFSLERFSICKGIAIGMFWAFVPMPLQMIPATFFCWLCRAYLPIALLAVWISNPLTYLPILYLEYKIGLLFFDDSEVMSFELMSQKSADMTLLEILSWILDTAGFVVLPLLVGSLVLSLVMATVGYFFGAVFYDKLKIRR